MIAFFQTKWAALAAGMMAYGLTTWLALQPQQQLARAVTAIQNARAARSAVALGPSWTFQNPELDHLVAELKNERENLRLRASQLDELEARIASERQEICVVTQTVFRLRTELDATITRVSEEEAVNLKKAAKVYIKMTPDGAARILKEMDDERIVKILAVMKDSESAPLLESLAVGNKGEAKRAATISNRLRLTLLESKKTPAP
jgi:flagellar motility protein MotE (MotC chaperone)